MMTKARPTECKIHYTLGNESWIDKGKRSPLRHHWEAWCGPLSRTFIAPTICGSHTVRCPYGVPGDVLYVKETWAQDLDGEVFYKSDHNTKPSTIEQWRSPIYMPHSASRITLEIMDVWVERVQDISDEDAREEGVELASEGDYWDYAFRRLWDSINSRRGHGWETNPWVWALTFMVTYEEE